MYHIPEHSLTFIHIPKNGGTSVRLALDQADKVSYLSLSRDLDDSESRIEETIHSGEWNHALLGNIKLSHLPLDVVRDFFPATWSAFVDSKSFALTRDPRERFISSLFQYLSEFQEETLVTSDDRRLTETAEDICERLASGGEKKDLELVHFRRQTDFTHIDGEQIVDEVFPLSQMDRVTEWCLKFGGLDLAIDHQHQRRQARGPLKTMLPLSQAVARRILTKRVREAMYPYWVGSSLFRSAADGYAEVFLGDNVEKFVDSFYLRDSDLFQKSATQ